MPTSCFETVINPNLVFLYQKRIRSQFIYSVILSTILFTLVALPFINITISVRGIGLIQSSVEKVELLAPASGRLLYVNLNDNQKVTQGSTLLIIDGALLQEQKGLVNNQVRKLKEQLYDIENLIKVAHEHSQIGTQVFKTSIYTTSWQLYVAQFQSAFAATQQAERIYLRSRTLYTKNAVTLSELELHKFNFEQALTDQLTVNKNYINQWQIEANAYRNELRELQSQKTQLNEQLKQYSLKATLNGSVQNLTGLQKGSYVYANQKLGEISPDNALFAYLYVRPSDIGLLKKGLSVRIQVDAFNYHQWGVLAGKIIDISDDIIMKTQSPYFKIKCQLDRNYLQLKSGYKGYVKKGMTLKASFMITKRNLCQLLLDNVENWVNVN